MECGQMAFDLSKYMTAEERIELFAKDNPDFRYEVNHEFYKDSNGDTWVVVKAILWRTEVDPNAWVMGLAAENMKTQFAIEKAETSAYARAITNTGKPQFSTTREGEKAPRANRAEMEKVNQEKPQSFQDKLQSRQNMYGKAGSKSAQIETILRDSFEADKKEPEPVAWSVGDVVAEIGASIPNEPPACQHGHILKEGISKGGKPYRGYVCKAKQCDPKWAKLTANGKWYFEGGE
jgi:hypothetical protein